MYKKFPRYAAAILACITIFSGCTYVANPPPMSSTNVCTWTREPFDTPEDLLQHFAEMDDPDPVMEKMQIEDVTK